MDLPRHGPPWVTPRTAYLHIPFCGHHCGYCDFAVTAGQDELIEPYIDALLQELATLGEPWPVETLFLGGGTPTYLTPSQLERLLAGIRHWLPLVGSDPEFSIESTPESITPDKVLVLAEAGITRVSVGVQSFEAPILHSLDRLHGVEQIPRAVAWIRERIPSLSFDLMFAAPGGSLDQWQRDLDQALTYAPEHISTYGLTYEKGTPLWKQRERGSVIPQDEDQELAMYQWAIGRLTDAGYEHYEISNFARPGHRCRHNERYWANEAYHGFGVGAARYVNGRRELNVRNTALYIQRLRAGQSPTFQSEELSPRDRAFETIATQLRRADGIHRQHFTEQTGYILDDLVGQAIQMTQSLGLLDDDGIRITLTPAGKYVADAVVEEFLKGNREGSDSQPTQRQPLPIAQ